MKNLFVILSMILLSCSSTIEDKKSVPEWTKDAIMYEVNVHQYTQRVLLNHFQNTYQE